MSAPGPRHPHAGNSRQDQGPSSTDGQWPPWGRVAMSHHPRSSSLPRRSRVNVPAGAAEACSDAPVFAPVSMTGACHQLALCRGPSGGACGHPVLGGSRQLPSQSWERRGCGSTPGSSLERKARWQKADRPVPGATPIIRNRNDRSGGDSCLPHAL